MSERRASMVGAGGAARARGSGGEVNVAGDGSTRPPGAAAITGALAAGLVARTSISAPLRLPNTTSLQAVPYFARNFERKGERNELRGCLVSPRPVSRCAICRNISVVRWLAATSAIIWPLFAAEPKICGSNGIVAIGWVSIALANSAALISGRFGTPTWLRQYSGGRSLGREALIRS